ncbi:hypothetical protein [Ohtaekwangia sp.]|uniref:hypothetical protein n=1 Tax=Ohtaekwangia sp. TaxID=2066019 RepID=UPI002F928A53
MREHLFKEFLTLNYNDSALAVVAKWLVSPTPDEFRTGLDCMLAAMQRHNTGKLIVDTTFLGAIQEEDQQWASSDWYYRAKEAGYKRVAIILPTEVFTKMSVQDTMDAVREQYVDTGYFDNVDAALEWIGR